MGVTRRVDPQTADHVAAYRVATLDGAAHGDVDGMARRALESVLAVTRSPVGFIALVDDAAELRITSSASDTNGEITADAMRSLARRVMEDESSRAGGPNFMGVPVRLGSAVVGMIGVSGAPTYSPAEREALHFFADHFATALELARVRESRQALVETLLNTRAELQLSEERRVVMEERARSAERLENAHALAIQALVHVAANLRAGTDLPDFYRLLTRSVARLVGATRILFWQLDNKNMLNAIPGAYGIDDEFIARLYPAPTDPEGTDLTSQVVFKDMIFRAALGDKQQSARDRNVLDRLQVRDAISVPWRAGEERLGVIAAYDSQQAGGFTPEDAWVLQIVGLAAGLVWQLKHSEAELSSTVERLQRVDSARQLLLRNLSSAVDSAQKRFASELHDDALQKLTAAELRLERAANPDTLDLAAAAAAVKDTQGILIQVEEALRKLLFNVRPPALDSEGGLEQTMRDRISLLRTHTGIDAEVEYSVTSEPPFEIKSMVYRQISEALTNIEKHAAASKVRIKAHPDRGGLYVSITDDGRGFIVSERSHLPGHLGLLALKERALLAGGWCKISSEPGAGTIIEFWVPMPE